MFYSNFLYHCKNLGYHITDKEKLKGIKIQITRLDTDCKIFVNFLYIKNPLSQHFQANSQLCHGLPASGHSFPHERVQVPGGGVLHLAGPGVRCLLLRPDVHHLDTLLQLELQAKVI